MFTYSAWSTVVNILLKGMNGCVLLTIYRERNVK